MNLMDAPDFFLLRSPLLPYRAVLNLSSESLREWYQQPLLQEALFIASPDLYESFQAWLREKMPEKKDKDKMEITLLKYLLRMSYRCTPFGLFAGISLGQWGKSTGILLAEQAQYQRCCRLDMDYLCALALHVTQNSAIRNQLTFFPNNTLYQVGNQLRYVEYRIHKKNRNHHLVNVEASEYMDKILTRSRHGVKPLALAGELVDEDISLEEAGAFVEEIINSQLLVSELEPFLTGEEYVFRLQKRLQPYESSYGIAGQLAEIAGQLTQLDHVPLGEGIPRYREIVEKLKPLETAFEVGQLFQVDMRKPTRQQTVHDSVVGELQQAVKLLAGIAPDSEVENLKSFRDAFYERYEEREIPLMEALDAEMGLSYPVTEHSPSDNSPLLSELRLAGNGGEPYRYEWSAWQQFLLEKYLATIRHNRSVIELQESEMLAFVNPKAPALPGSLYAMVSVLAPSPQAVDEGNFRLVSHTIGGPSVANLLGRFCHLDAGLAESVRRALRVEEAQAPEAIFAEIVHLNQSRNGNIARRPVLRDYEIPIMVQAGVDEEHTIRLEDLVVSVRNNRLMLRSKRLGKEVIPRLSNAHNYSLQALPVYHFLCDLQFQGTHRGLAWNWGVLSQTAFLPRVCYGKTILSKARWILKETEWPGLTAAALPALVEEMNQLRSQRNIPRWVVVAEGDNDLPLDLENTLCLKVLQSLFKSRQQVELEENLFDSSNLLVEGPEGGYTHEMIVPLQYTPEKIIASPGREQAPDTLPIRSFGLGTEWLYVKLYCGVKTADKLLTEVVKPLTEKWLAEGVIDQWFFIRYTDPKHHLRVRFHGNASQLFYGQLIFELEAALQPYTNAHLLTGLQTDTYHRELERYGYDNILASESLFFHDSVAAVNVLDMLSGDEGDQLRWRLALRGVDILLSDFGLNGEAKKKLMDQLQARFKLEFNVTHAHAKKHFGDKFRRERASIESVLQSTPVLESEWSLACQVFDARSQHWKETIGQILQKYREGSLQVDLDDLLASYLHMFLNRFFRSRQRMHEVVVYDFLFQHYSSLLAREKQKVS